ncbi:MAG: class I SAM-dependent methyltransferase [Pseudomonadota bacterium]
MAVLVQPVKLTAQGTFFGDRFLLLTPRQAFIEETWEGFLERTLGPELLPEELEALERALKKFRHLSSQKLENPYFWESWAPTWAEYSRRNLNRGLILLNRLGSLESHPTIISLGAGSCWQEAFLAQYCCQTSQIFGVDFSSHMLKQGTLLARKRKISNIHPVVAKVEQLPLSEKAGDLIMSLNLLDLIPDIPRVLREIKRILNPPPLNRYFFVFPLDPRDRLQRKAEHWRSMIVQAGLDEPILFCLSGKNYQGKSLRLLGLTNIDPFR